MIVLKKSNQELHKNNILKNNQNYIKSILDRFQEIQFWPDKLKCFIRAQKYTLNIDKNMFIILV